MMNMLLRHQYLYSIVNALIDQMKDIDQKKYFAIHLYGVAQYAAFFAACNRLNMEIAATSGLLHDIYVVQTGIGEDHARNGAEIAEKILKDINQFNGEEIHIIKQAILFHSDKQIVHNEYDEILKNADVLHYYIYKPNDDLNYTESRKNRINHILEQFSVPNDKSIKTISDLQQ